MSRGDLQSLSYSCLGQPRRQEDEEEEDDEEQYMREQARRLSRNLSLSHESVFHIDSHSGQVSRLNKLHMMECIKVLFYDSPGIIVDEKAPDCRL